MQQKEQTKLALEEQIEIINEILNELKNTQEDELKIIRNNHVTHMKKLDKLQEYNKIADITNQVFEKRLCSIENSIKQINKTISA